MTQLLVSFAVKITTKSLKTQEEKTKTCTCDTWMSRGNIFYNAVLSMYYVIAVCSFVDTRKQTINERIMQQDLFCFFFEK